MKIGMLMQDDAGDGDDVMIRKEDEGGKLFSMS